MLSVFFYTLYNIVDAYWVSKLSPEAIAAVSVAQISLFLMISLGFGITIGSGVIMAMDLGAKNQEGAERVLGQSFVLMAIAGVVFSAIAILFREPLLIASGATGEIFPLALEYFTITSVGAPLFFILFAIMFAFNSQGDTLTLAKLFAISTAINLVLDPLFIFGWGVPAMGIGGAAVATIVSQAAFICIAVYSLSRPQRSVPFKFTNLRVNLHSVVQVLKIGVPASLTQLINPIGLAALTFLAGYAFAEPGAVAMSLGFRLEFFAYLPAVGFGFAAMAMMGQCIGAKNLERARQILWVAMLYAISIAVVFGIVVALAAPWIIKAFTTDPTVTEYTLSYFRIVALSYGFLAAMMVEASAFQAVGKSWPGFWIGVLRFLLVSAPLAYVGSVVLGYAINSIWLAMVAGNVLAALVGYVWLQHMLKHYDFTQAEEAIGS